MAVQLVHWPVFTLMFDSAITSLLAAGAALEPDVQRRPFLAECTAQPCKGEWKTALEFTYFF